MTCSCGDLVFAFERGDPAVGVAPVAVGDVVGEGALGCGPVAVVGVVEDELLDRAEVALDPVLVAGVGRCRDEFDLVGGGVVADPRCSPRPALRADATPPRGSDVRG
jgi:hypothetical protein